MTKDFIQSNVNLCLFESNKLQLLLLHLTLSVILLFSRRIESVSRLFLIFADPCLDGSGCTFAFI